MTIASSPDLIQPLGIGGGIPDGPLKTMDGKQTSLYEVQGTSGLVIIFYRGDW